jgi:hypothetical protein
MTRLSFVYPPFPYHPEGRRQYFDMPEISNRMKMILSIYRIGGVITLKIRLKTR